MFLKIKLTLVGLVTCLALEALPPQTYHNALRQRYPQATDIFWRQTGNDYVATFQLGGFLTHAWLTADGQWLMTDTDLQTADQLPAMVYHYFTLSSYAGWNLTDVHRIELADDDRNEPGIPTQQEVLSRNPSVIDPVRYVLTVNYDNSTGTYQLFYTPDGVLVRTRDVSYLPTTLTPQDFF